MNNPTTVLDSEVLNSVISGNIAQHARNIGISRQHLNNILKGKRQPSAEVLLRIQSIYKLSAQKISAKG